MTVVSAANFFSELTVLTDSRVSANGQPIRTDYGLLKMVPIENRATGTVFILAFSGYLSGIEPLLSFVLPKLMNSKRRFVLAHLKDDLVKWISEAALQSLDKPISTTNFLLCGLEALKRQLLVDQEGLRSVSPFHDPHIYLYSITDKGRVSVKGYGSGIVIGSGSELQHEITFLAHDLLSAGRSSTHGEEFRALIFCYTIAQRFREAQVSTVGGPYLVGISRPGYFRDYFWWPDEQPNSNALLLERLQSNVKITNTLNNRTCELLHIWEWRDRFPEDFAVSAAYC